MKGGKGVGGKMVQYELRGRARVSEERERKKEGKKKELLLKEENVVEMNETTNEK